MTNILIPSNLSAESLQLAEKAIKYLQPVNANILLFHAFEMPDSAFDLLVPGRSKPYADAMNDGFRYACRQLKTENQKAVQKVCFKYLEGNSNRLFRNFIDANEIDVIICPDDYVFTAIHKLSVDPRPLFKKSGIRVIRELSLHEKEIQMDVNTPIQLSVLTAAS
jgi:hypothetical protein